MLFNISKNRLISFQYFANFGTSEDARTIGGICSFDQTEKNIYHGHVRNWNELTTEMKNALKEAGLVNDKGKIK
ncbi:Exoprotein adhesin or hemolysin [Bibersteinia trehalosi USDA-ARS-USMARC-190]|uniref:Exoprotein adhesin or hemolysin n=1 Tax=Bibersteinia trehalosi USDA-ARS-USMARC-190 TaxID=1263832 RepID=W0RAQ0_BIBTR|nr:Exoprotein adhesin or hemolysin [Bibersteinia trehalosi USDA-ARS-USMARC-190]